MATWYVSPDGSDTTGDGSESNRFQTMTHAISVNGGGDISLILAAGTYSGENISVSNLGLNITAEGIATISGSGTFLNYSCSGGNTVYFESLTFSGYINVASIVNSNALNFTLFRTLFCSIQNTQISGQNIETRFTSTNLSGATFDLNDYSRFVGISSNMTSATFSHNATNDYSKECVCYLSGCNLTNSTGVFAAQISSTFIGTLGSISNCNFTGAEVTICDVSGDGYTSRRAAVPTAFANNTCTGIKARFINSASDNWATINAIPYTECAYYETFAALALSHTGTVVYSSDFYLPPTPVLVPSIVNPSENRASKFGGFTVVDPRPRLKRQNLFAGFDSFRFIATNDVVATLTNSVDINNDLTQATDANKPQIGYRNNGKFTAQAANLVHDGSNLISQWTNEDTAGNYLKLPNMTQATEANKPTWNAVNNYVDFTNNKTLSATALVTNTVQSFTLDMYLQSSSGLSQNALYQAAYVIYGLSTGTYARLMIEAAPNSSTVSLSASIFVTGFNAVSATYTYAQLNALLSVGLKLSAVYMAGTLMFYINGAFVGTIGATTSLTIAQRSAITSSFVSGTISVKSINVYQSALTASEVSLLYTNRNDYSYKLPKNAIVTTGVSIMSAVINANVTMNQLTISFWVYMQSVKAGVFVGSDSFVDTPNKGFQVSQTVASSLYYFRSKFGDGTNGWGHATTQLSKAAFETLYLNKWVNVIATFNNGIARIYINAVSQGSTTGPTGSIVMPLDGIISILGSSGIGSMRAGNKIEAISMYNNAFTLAQAKAQYYFDKNKFRHLN